MPAVTVQQAFDLALQHHQAGRLSEAERLYRQILAVDPRHADALHRLGIIAYQAGRSDSAVKLISQAIDLRPGYADGHNDLGVILAESGKPDEAVAAYRRALVLEPQFADAHNNLGNALAARGQLDEAIASYRCALALRPDYAQAHNNLGNALTQRSQLDEAIASYRRALTLRPNDAQAYNNLGNALHERGHLDEASGCYRRALDIVPNYTEAHSNLAGLLMRQGQLEEAIAEYRQALQFGPARARMQSNLIWALHFLPTEIHAVIGKEHENWNRQFANPIKRFHLPYPNSRDPDRRLRVGYVSPDFRDHVVGKNLLPLFKHHGGREVEVICYSGVLRPDALTEQFQRHADRWRNTMALSDDAFAGMIHEDGVDILVDLTQHLADNRLPIFARKPAPVQVSFAGYPESTGLEAIEYRISDKWLEAGASEDGDRSAVACCKGDAGIAHLDRGSEQVYLIDSFWCYDPCGMEVTVNELPAKQNGRITFGSLNNFAKINYLVLDLWAKVLRSVRDSRLVLSSHLGSHQQLAIDFLEQRAVEPRRVEFITPRPTKDYLELYHHLDIALDPFPYGGHTTSLDALWMGVPVVSLAGERSVSRAGLSILNNLGLQELVTFSEEEFVKIAANLARDLPRLAELRRTLRSRMKNSVLMDGPRFARQIEAAYRAMWRQWCTGKPGA